MGEWVIQKPKYYFHEKYALSTAPVSPNGFFLKNNCCFQTRFPKHKHIIVIVNLLKALTELLLKKFA